VSSAPAQDSTETPIGYVELVRTNRNFRRLWIGNVVSLLGDWFNTLAIYALVAELTGSPMALGAVFIAKMLPWALASPIAGVLVDRFDRRRLMIASDLLRAVIVLGFLAVKPIGRVEVIFILAALQVVVGAVFEPARGAAIPAITKHNELLTANALSSITWSIMLTAGAAAGGLVTESEHRPHRAGADLPRRAPRHRRRLEAPAGERGGHAHRRRQGHLVDGRRRSRLSAGSARP
jgi:MFS family permease